MTEKFELAGHRWMSTCFSQSGRYGNCECGKADYLDFNQHQAHMRTLIVKAQPASPSPETAPPHNCEWKRLYLSSFPSGEPATPEQRSGLLEIATRLKLWADHLDREQKPVEAQHVRACEIMVREGVPIVPAEVEKWRKLEGVQNKLRRLSKHSARMESRAARAENELAELRAAQPAQGEREG